MNKQIFVRKLMSKVWEELTVTVVMSPTDMIVCWGDMSSVYCTSSALRTRLGFVITFPHSF